MTAPAPSQSLADPSPLNLKDAVKTYERTLIHATLVACDWNQRKASLTLGVLPTTLSEKLRRFDLRPPQTAPAPSSGSAARSTRALVSTIEMKGRTGTWCPSCGHGVPLPNAR